MNAYVKAFNFSGIKVKMGTDICKHFKSFVGRDFKALAQFSLFLFRDYFTADEKRVWIALSKVYTGISLLL